VVALGIVIATAAAFVVSALYYGAMPAAVLPEPESSRPIIAQVTVELLRNLAVAVFVAGLLAAADWSGLVTGALLGLSLWTLPVVLLAGSVFHEGVLMRRAAVHAVDWLIKLVAVGAILGLFR
jgi:Na+/pantothenate symporter